MTGSVTNPTGSWSGGSLTGLVDACCEAWSGYVDPFGGPPPTVQAQWQHWTLLTNLAGPCARNGTFGAGELTLRALHVGTIPMNQGSPAGHASTYPPAADLPLTFQGNGAWLTTSDGVLRHAACYARSKKDTLATSGTITFTRMDNVQYEGSYSLNFGSGLCTGSFVAPWCGTAPA